METAFCSSVDDIFQGPGFAAAKTHVGNGSFVSGCSSSGVLGLGSGCFACCALSSPLNPTDHIAHATTSVGSKDLDGDNISSLGNTEPAGGDGPSTMGAVSVAILVDIVLRHGRTPGRTALEFGVGDVNPGVNDVDINALAALGVVFVPLEGAEAEFGTVADARKTLCRSELN
jgi:hypothetical protein